MEALIILVALIGAGVVVAVLASRRGSQAPTAPSYSAPPQIDPKDFMVGDIPANVVMFGSETCQGCADMSAAIEDLSTSQDSAVPMLVMNEQQPELFEKYSIDGIPSTLIVNEEGVVSDSFFGPTSAERLTKAFVKLQAAD